MFHERSLSPEELVALSPEDRLSYMRQRIGHQQYREDHPVPGEYEPQEPPAETFPVHLLLTEQEMEMLLSILHQKIRHAQSMIDKCYDLPTINGPNGITIRKHQAVIDTVNSIIEKFIDQ